MSFLSFFKPKLPNVDFIYSNLPLGENYQHWLRESYHCCKQLQGHCYTVMGHDSIWNLEPYDIQLKAAVLLRGKNLLQIETGEGKTLIAALAAHCLYRSYGSCIICTCNDYLAQRDAEWMSPLFNALGLSVGYVINSSSTQQRKEAYTKNIVYTTLTELGFDYLRDHSITNREEDCVRPKFNSLILDEIDSLLIDDAQTPLILSQGYVDLEVAKIYQELNPLAETFVLKQSEWINNELNNWDSLTDTDKAIKLFQLYLGAPKNDRVQQLLLDPKWESAVNAIKKWSSLPLRTKELQKLKEELLYWLDEQEHSIVFGEKILQILGDKWDCLDEVAKLRHRQAFSKLMEGYVLLKKDVDYLIDNNKVVIIDSNTGRTQSNRRWGEGLHTALETINQVPLQPQTKVLASITLAQLVGLFKNISGMSGSIGKDLSYWKEMYNMNGITIPPHKKSKKVINRTKLFLNTTEKEAAIVKFIEAQHKSGNLQPILIGTQSVEECDRISQKLTLRGLTNHTLNAREHRLESDLIAKAGLAGAITVATPMAGRGTDITIDPSVQNKGLHVICSGHALSQRIDTQYAGRTARQGQPGEVTFFVALTDDLYRIYGNGNKSRIINAIFNHNYSDSLKPYTEKLQKESESIILNTCKELVKYDSYLTELRNNAYNTRDTLLQKGSADDFFMQIQKYTLEWEYENNPKYSDWVLTNYPVPISINPIIDLENLEQAYELRKNFEDKAMWDGWISHILITSIDYTWAMFLSEVESLKSEIQLRKYANEKPIDAFANELYKMYGRLQYAMGYTIMKIFTTTTTTKTGLHDWVVELQKKSSQNKS